MWEEGKECGRKGRSVGGTEGASKGRRELGREEKWEGGREREERREKGKERGRAESTCILLLNRGHLLVVTLHLL